MKICLVIAGVFLFFLPALVSGKGDQQIVMYLSFDEGKGDIANDESGNGHDAEIFKAKWVKGQFGEALEFDGPGNYAQTKPDKSFAFKAKDEITVMAWIKQAQADIGVIIYNRPEANRCNFGFRSENLGISWFYRDKGDATWEGVKSDPPNLIPLDEWVHVAATNTFAEGKDEMKVYLNGEERNTVLGWGPANADPIELEGPIDIGARWGGQDHLFNGIIDEVSIWRGIFSEADLEEIMEGPTSDYLAVQAHGKLATTWARIKNFR